MTKHRKHKTNKRRQRRRQRGGFWPFDANADSTEPTPTNTDYTAQASAYATDATKKASELGAYATGLFNSLTESTGSTVAPVTTAPPTTSQYKPEETVRQIEGPINASPSGVIGGKKRKKSFKGGKGGLGLAYYATPVSGLKVVEPNEWLLYNNMANLKGGSRRRKCKTRKRKTRKRKTRRCKR